jgi:hypothetical protein
MLLRLEKTGGKLNAKASTEPLAFMRPKPMPWPVPELAKSNALGQVIIHEQRGKIQTEYTSGDDPYPLTG